MMSRRTRRIQHHLVATCGNTARFHTLQLTTIDMENPALVDLGTHGEAMGKPWVFRGSNSPNWCCWAGPWEFLRMASLSQRHSAPRWGMVFHVDLLPCWEEFYLFFSCFVSSIMCIKDVNNHDKYVVNYLNNINTSLSFIDSCSIMITITIISILEVVAARMCSRWRHRPTVETWRLGTCRNLDPMDRCQGKHGTMETWNHLQILRLPVTCPLDQWNNDISRKEMEQVVQWQVNNGSINAKQAMPPFVGGLSPSPGPQLHHPRALWWRPIFRAHHVRPAAMERDLTDVMEVSWRNNIETIDKWW